MIWKPDRNRNRKFVCNFLFCKPITILCCNFTRLGLHATSGSAKYKNKYWWEGSLSGISQKNPNETNMKEFNIKKVADLQPLTLLTIKLLFAVSFHKIFWVVESLLKNYIQWLVLPEGFFYALSNYSYCSLLLLGKCVLFTLRFLYKHTLKNVIADPFLKNASQVGLCMKQLNVIDLFRQNNYGFIRNLYYAIT